MADESIRALPRDAAVLARAEAASSKAVMDRTASRGISGNRALRLDGATRQSHVIALAVILAALLGIWIYGATHHFIPCDQNCGEAFDALQYVDNYHLYGFRYGLVQDMATGVAPESRPYLYTHNVNLAGIVFTLLEAIGLRPLWAKQLVTLAATGAGFWYAYRALAYHSRSWVAGVAVLLLLVTEAEHVLAFALNPLRAWQLLPIFGLIFHVGRLVREPRLAPWVDRGAIVLLATAAFGIGYDYWVVCGGLAVAMFLLGRGRRLISFGTLGGLIGIATAFAIPFVLRQIQIATVLGPSFWFTDVVLSAAIKVSVLSRLVAVPSTEELDAMYQAVGVLRPPASPASSLTAILSTLVDMVTYVSMPSYGLLPLLLVVVVGLFAVGVVLLAWLLRPRRLVQLLARLGLVGARRAGLIGSARMVVALTFAVGAGLAFFAPLSLHIYLKHEFPLVVAPILTVKALVLAACVSVCLQARSLRGWTFLVPAGLALFIAVDHLVVQAEDLRARQPMDVSWIPAVTERASSSFAISYVPNVASVFTDTWVVGIPPGKERELAERPTASGGQFTLDDYFLFGERDGRQHAATYERPDFWLYFPTEQVTPFDQTRPTCRQDYLTRIAVRLAGGMQAPIVQNPLYAAPNIVKPGGLLTFGALVSGGRQSGISAELLSDDRLVTDLNYACTYGKVLGEYRLPPDAEPGMRVFKVQLRQPDQRIVPLGLAEVKVDPTIGNGPPRTPGAGRPQPSIDEMIALFPDLPVAERGDGWVIFDLRAARQGRR